MIVSEINNGLMILKLSKPQLLNSLDSRLLEKLKKEIMKACRTPNVNFIVLTGEGKLFSSGIDLREIASSSDEAEASRPFRALGEVIRVILDCKKPVITVLNGPAVAGGAELMLASDLVFAVEGIWIEWPEISWNLVAPMLSSLLSSMPLPKLLYLALDSKRISAEEALSLGIISEIVKSVDEAISKIRELSIRLAKNTDAMSFYISKIREAKKRTLINLDNLIILAESKDLILRAQKFFKK